MVVFTFIVLTAAAGAAGARAADPAGPADPPVPYETNNHDRVLHYRISAPSLGESGHSVRVYVPRDYSAQRTRRYPVVYLLHGWPGGDGNWAGQGHALDTIDSLAAAGKIPEVIAVMPNGAGAGLWGRSLYLNSYDGKSRMEDFVTRDLVHWIDASFRTRADSAHRALIGLSEGATGALNIAFRHPDVFSACGGHSGQYALGHDVGMSAVFGPEPGASRLRAENSPTLYVDRIVATLKKQAIYFDCGTDDGELEDNRALHKKLESLGVAHTYREFPGHHSWGYWRVHLRESLIACLSGMR
ncbi:MAG TPA: alpha/beta hydrolase family protein [Candidatus Udaeobacter sp.]|jgi:S-formylglutathione hydrolase FrmB|nr:alpha/beta hydrolase family protein [Candidatus Udaeobacter sp.]